MLNAQNLTNFAIFTSCLGLLKYSTLYIPSEITKPQINKLLKANDLVEIFQEDRIFKNQFKNMLHLSTPFNRKIKYIYNLPFFYTEYENYNFNKLSDFFLNIHIFIN
jgi:hypothetical protein